MLMFEPLRKYVDFESRATRSEYWLFFLFRILLFFGLTIAAVIVAGVMGIYADDVASRDPAVAGVYATVFFSAFGLAWLSLFLPTLAVSVRRLHDSDKSGFWLLLNFVPFGGLVIFIFDLIDGTPGPNRYGPDPKGRPGYGTTEIHHHHYAVS